jgi:hypothetical protein
LVFKAFIYESNRYQLCRLIAKGTRKLHRPNTRLQEATNGVIERFSAPVSMVEAARFAQPRKIAVPHKRRACRGWAAIKPVSET